MAADPGSTVIVYRDQRTSAHPEDTLRTLARQVERLPRRPDHDSVVGLLVEVAALEAGVADALAAECDDEEPVTGELRAVTLAAGHALVASWRGQDEAVARWCAELGGRLHGCAALPLPTSVELGVPEGFGQYGLYPECYIEAAEQVSRALRPAAAVCIGIRSIGTALSAVVAACLQAEGCAVTSWTLRPRGHPFDRRPVLGAALRARLAASTELLFLIVDEGPGISGSSLGGTAELLGSLGVPDSRIVLLPSWDPPPELLRSTTAQGRWTRHRRFVSGFEQVWVESGRLDDLLTQEPVSDMGAGRWREELIADGARRPTIHPQHERRKFRSPGSLARFAGLGSLGHERLARARTLAELGFSPHPSRLAHGFLALELAPGTPLARGEVDADLLDRMARYLASLRERFALPDSARTDLSEMIHVNLDEAGLEAWADTLHDPADGPPVAVDGRMLPHEWVRTSRGYLKVDALDHHDDHFFPGPVDIAWDIAAAAVEFAMPAQAREILVERYRRLSGDRTIAGRLPYYTVAYLACRIGYASLAAEVLRGTAEGDGFQRMLRGYRARLDEPTMVGAASDG
jgi:hypothetical protein